MEEILTALKAKKKRDGQKFDIREAGENIMEQIIRNINQFFVNKRLV